jgi:hypothetical protein
MRVGDDSHSRRQDWRGGQVPVAERELEGTVTLAVPSPQRLATAFMQREAAQSQDARPLQQIRPRIRMLRSVAQFEDAHIERRTKVRSDEIVGARLVEHLYAVIASERPHERGGVIERI